jgi:hypothetical protein
VLLELVVPGVAGAVGSASGVGGAGCATGKWRRRGSGSGMEDRGQRGGREAQA